MNFAEYYKDSRFKKVKMISFILRNDWPTAEDIVQEASLRALRFIHSYDPNRGTVDKWFNSILFNALHDYQKSDGNRPTSPIDQLCVDDVLKDVELAETVDLNGYIEHAIRGVDNAKHRRILELFFLMGYTSMEISQIEHKTTQTNVTTVVMRFRERLKDENQVSSRVLSS